jgi:hypothetical protein
MLQCGILDAAHFRLLPNNILKSLSVEQLYGALIDDLALNEHNARHLPALRMLHGTTRGQDCRGVAKVQVLSGGFWPSRFGTGGRGKVALCV